MKIGTVTVTLPCERCGEDEWMLVREVVEVAGQDVLVLSCKACGAIHLKLSDGSFGLLEVAP